MYIAISSNENTLRNWRAQNIIECSTSRPMFDGILEQFMEDQYEALRQKIDATNEMLDDEQKDEAISLIEEVRNRYEQMVVMFHDCAEKLAFEPCLLTFLRDEIVRVYDRLGWTENGKEVVEE